MPAGDAVNVAQAHTTYAPPQPYAAPSHPAGAQAAPLATPAAPSAHPAAQAASTPAPPQQVAPQYAPRASPQVVAGTPAPPAMGPPPQPQHITVERGCQKKTRLVWTQELHMRFLFAVEKIGLRTAVPRTILQVMQVEGLTRENIASHLQKYRRLLEKKAGISGPVSTKDWPKLEAAQSQHLAQLRKQMDAATAAAATSNADSKPTGGAPEPAVTRTATMPGRDAQGASSSAAAAAAEDASVPQPPALPAPAEAVRPAAPAAPAAASAPPVSSGAAAPAQMWSQAPATPACAPQPTALQQLPQPGLCPVTPQEPPPVRLPTSADAEGNTLGVPMPQPIMPPLMCVLPQADGSPALLPMLPAMYMASYGRNTPDVLGTVPLQRQQVPGLSTAPPAVPQYPAMPLPAPVYPPPQYAYQPQYHPAMPSTPAGVGQPMFPAYNPHMPMPAPMPHPDASAMHAQHAWPRPSSWRPPSSKAPPSARSTLPPLVAEHGPQSTPRNGTGGAASGHGREDDPGRPPGALTTETAGAGGTRRQRLQGLRSVKGRSQSTGNVPAVGSSARSEPAGDLSDDAIARSLALTSSTLRLGNMKLESDADGAGLDAIQEAGTGMDLDELGWPDWHEPDDSRHGAGDGEDGDAEDGGGDADDPVASAIADIFTRAPPQTRRTRKSMSASFL